MNENKTLILYILLGWASISGTLLVSSTEDGGPGLSPEYVHVYLYITFKYKNAYIL